jgi:ribosome-binding factor A
MRENGRADRVGDEIKSVIASALLLETRDERLQQVEVTAVRVSPDLTVAKVYWVIVSSEPPSQALRDRTAKALGVAAGFLRSNLAKNLRLRAVPTLTFAYDESVESGRQMETLLAKLPKPAAEE